MRLILAYLALFELRRGMFAFAISRRLGLSADRAQQLGHARIQRSDRLMRRALAVRP